MDHAGTAPSTTSLELVDGSDVVADTLTVSVRPWPVLSGAVTRAQVADRATWPSDPDCASRWDLWGFMPDSVTHPGLPGR